MLENSADPEVGGGLEVAQTHVSSDQVCGLLNSLVAIDKDEAVAEPAMEKNRDGDESLSHEFSQQIAGHGELCDIELAIADHPPVADIRGHVCEHGKIDAVRLDAAVHQGADDFVIPAGQG